MRSYCVEAFGGGSWRTMARLVAAGWLVLAGPMGEDLQADPIQAQWVRVNEVPADFVYDLEVAGSTLYAISADSLYERSANNETFVGIGTPGDTVDMWSLVHVGQRLLVGTFGDGVWESTDGGKTWLSRSQGLTGAAARTVSCFAVRGDSVYIGTDGAGILVSWLTGDLAWQPYRDGLLPDVAWTVYSLHAWNGMLLAGAGQNAYVHRNRPGLSYWEGFQFGPFIGTGLAMIGLGHTEAGNIIGVAFNGIYQSDDSGVTWSYHAAPFISGAQGRVVTAGDRLFAMITHLSLGMYIWEWKGGTWELFDHQPSLRALDLVYFEGRLYAACVDGLWYQPTAPLDVDPGEPILPSSAELSQNYPNPFNPSTLIGYRVPERAHVRLEVFNALGHRVAVLEDARRAAGEHVVEWDGRDDAGHEVAAGVYFYRLQAGDGVIAKKMLLIK